MNLTLNNLQVYFLADLLEPYRNSEKRYERNLVKKMDTLVKAQQQRDKESEELIRAIYGGNTPANCICCTNESIFGKEQSHD